MTTSTKDPILIVGAGPTGLVLAIWLKKLNPSISLRIISKASGPGTTSRAIVVHARTLEFYRQLGVADDLINAGVILDQVLIWRQGVRRGRLPISEIGAGRTKYPFMLSVIQEVHEKILLKHLQRLGVDVDWEHELQDIAQFPTNVLVTINGSKYQYSYVAGCDGAGSTVRTKSNLHMSGGVYPHQFFVADVRVDETAETAAINLAPDKQMMAVFIRLTEPGHCRIIGSFIAPEAVKEPNFEHVRGAVKAAASLDVHKVEWFSVYRVRHAVSEKFRERRVLLAGDAAHQHSPVGGQGMNTGIGDASNLAWKLASVYAGSAPDELLDTYNEERIKLAEGLVNTTDKAFTLFADEGWAGWLFRGFIFPFVMPLMWKIPPVQAKVFQTVSQIGAGYPDSSLNGLGSPCSGIELRAGQRLPWVSGGDMDTHDPLPFPRWHIVRFVERADEKSTAAIGRNVPIRTYEYVEEAGAKGFVRDKAYLVRPDGHVALVLDGVQDKQLGDYLERWGVNREYSSG